MKLASEAEPGQLWTTSWFWDWCVRGKETPKTFFLTRRIGSTNTWFAFCVEDANVKAIVLSSGMYDRLL